MPDRVAKPLKDTFIFLALRGALALVFSIACIAAQAKPLFGTLLPHAETAHSDSLLVKEKTDEVTEADEINAAFSLGLHYERTGKGKPNSRKAIEHYRKAAERGHTEAQYRLGRLFALWWVVFGEEDEARKWLEKAAFAGMAKAKVALAYFERRVGNYEKGVALMLELEDRLNDEQRFFIYDYLEDMTLPAKGKISKTLEAAFEFVKRKANDGDAFALNVLSVSHCVGIKGHFPYDIDRAIALNKKARAGQTGLETLDRKKCESFHEIFSAN